MLRGVGAAHLYAGGVCGLLGRHSRVALVFNGRVEKAAQFFVHLVVGFFAIHKSAKTGGDTCE
jgi:hypothetical protein